MVLSLVTLFAGILLMVYYEGEPNKWRCVSGSEICIPCSKQENNVTVNDTDAFLLANCDFSATSNYSALSLDGLATSSANKTNSTGQTAATVLALYGVNVTELDVCCCGPTRAEATHVECPQYSSELTSVDFIAFFMTVASTVSVMFTSLMMLCFWYGYLESPEGEEKAQRWMKEMRRANEIAKRQ